MRSFLTMNFEYYTKRANWVLLFDGRFFCGVHMHHKWSRHLIYRPTEFFFSSSRLLSCSSRINNIRDTTALWTLKADSFRRYGFMWHELYGIESDALMLIILRYFVWIEIFKRVEERPAMSPKWAWFSSVDLIDFNLIQFSLTTFFGTSAFSVLGIFTHEHENYICSPIDSTTKTYVVLY